MRVNIHTINDSITYEDVMSLSFDGYSIYDNHCDDSWNFPDMQICIRFNNKKIETLLLPRGSCSINDNAIDIYVSKIYENNDHQIHNHAKNPLFNQYITHRHDIFKAHNYMKEFLQKL